MSALHAPALVASVAGCFFIGVAAAQTEAPPAPPVPAAPAAAAIAPPVTALADTAAPEVPDLTPDPSRGGAFGGLSWATLGGTEVEKADPVLGFEGGAFVRVWRGAGLWGSFALHSHSLSGQISQLLDQPLRPRGRSATVDGSIKVTRARVGVRLESVRQADWRFVPYVVGAVSFAKIDVTVDKVDGAAPLPVPDALGKPVDVSRFDKSRLGGLGRFGVEYDALPHIRVDLHADYEVYAFPPGTAASAALGANLVYRL